MTMKISRCIMATLVVGTLLVPALQAQSSQAEEQQLKAYIDMMRKNLRTEKQSIVDGAMELEAADKAKFWDVYSKYQTELTALWDQRLKNVETYADNFEKMTDAVADQLVAKALDIEQQKTALKKKYYGMMKAALSARVAARFLQVETALDHLVDLQLGTEIPLMP